MNIIGQRINNYEVHHLIGEGGMGAVYIAQHVVIGRKAAIKVLRREFSEDQGLVARFMNEARAAAAIGHPNIVDVVDVGALPDGTPYMMMEYLVGEDLSKRLARVGRLSLEQALPIAFQAGSAIAAAHEKGIVHRDLKPENLFLVPDPTAPGRERVKVLDFGIAKLRGDFSGGSVKTKTGSLLGTPQYMSPEQCRGIPDGIDHRSDIYSFGIILYEMLCGSPPFVSEGLGDILLMHLTQLPDPPSARNPEIPEWLEKLLLCALEKDSANRFSSMDEMLAALESSAQATMLAPPHDGARTPTPVFAPMRGDLGRTPAPVSLPVRGDRGRTPAPVSLPVRAATRLQPGQTGSGQPGQRQTAVPQSTLSPLVADVGADTFVTFRRRGLAVGGAIAAAVAILLVVYLLFGRGRGIEAKNLPSVPSNTGQPRAAAVQPPPAPAAPVPAAPVPIPSAQVAQPSPRPTAEKAEALPPAELSEKTHPASKAAGSASPGASAGRSSHGSAAGKRPASKSAAPRETSSEAAEKW